MVDFDTKVKCLGTLQPAMSCHLFRRRAHQLRKWRLSELTKERWPHRECRFWRRKMCAGCPSWSCILYFLVDITAFFESKHADYLFRFGPKKSVLSLFKAYPRFFISAWNQYGLKCFDNKFKKQSICIQNVSFAFYSGHVTVCSKKLCVNSFTRLIQIATTQQLTTAHLTPCVFLYILAHILVWCHFLAFQSVDLWSSAWPKLAVFNSCHSTHTAATLRFASVKADATTPNFRQLFLCAWK